MPKRKKVFRGDRLRATRERLTLSQEDLAARIGISQSQLQGYERRGKEPTAEIITRLSRELGVTADWLLGLVEHPDQHLSETQLSEREVRLIEAARRNDTESIIAIMAEIIREKQVK